MEKESELKMKISTEKEESLNEKLNALEEENEKLKAKVCELKTSSDYYGKELQEIQHQAQNFEAHNSFLVFENNKLKNSNSTLKTEYEKLQKRLCSIDEHVKKYGNNHQSDVEQISKKLEDEKNCSILKSALLIQQNLQHSEEKKIWITICNDFCVKMNLLKNENAQLFGELKYYREAFSSGSGSGNDEVVVPTKRKRKSLNPQQKEVQQQQPNITEKLPDSKKNDIQFSAPENFASNNPGSSTQLNFL